MFIPGFKLKHVATEPIGMVAVMKTLNTVLFAAGLVMAWPVSTTAAEAAEPPVPVRMVPPQYPSEMRRDGTSGVVTISCLIDEKGNVQDPKVLKSTNDAFVQPALAAIQKWKFKPAKREGNVVSVRVNIPIQFMVSDE